MVGDIRLVTKRTWGRGRKSYISYFELWMWREEKGQWGLIISITNREVQGFDCFGGKIENGTEEPGIYIMWTL
jgi:hypothetical protein